MTPIPIIPNNQDPFARLPEAELNNVLTTGEHTFFGLTMSQHPHAPLKLNQLLMASQPARIIEIGAGNGGLTVLLALYAKMSGCKLYSYDKTPGKHAALLDQLGYPVILQDVLENDDNIREVKALVSSPGRTILLCDAGKALEFNLYVPSFKPGDLVLMHDFAPDEASYKRDFEGKIWNWHEAWYDRVSQTSIACGIVHSSWSNDVAWSLGYKPTVKA